MIMRKRKILPSQTHFPFSRITLTLYIIGMPIIAVPLFYMTMQLTAHDALSIPEVKYYANALEHILAGLTLLTCGCYLVERVVRKSQKRK